MSLFQVKFALLLISFVLLAACGGGFGGETIDPTSTTTVSGEEVSLAIAAGTFTEAINVKLSEGVTDVSTISTGTPISSAVRLEFSQVALTRNDTGMTLTLQIPPDTLATALSEGKTVYALVRITGDQPQAGEMASFTGWQEVFGTLDQGTSTLSIPLFATAEQIEVVVISAAPLKIYVDPATLSALTVHNHIQKVVVSDWQKRPWAIVCKTETLPDAEKGLCDESSSDFALKDLVTQLEFAAFFLTSLDWNKANLQTDDVNGLALLAGGTGALGLPDDFDETAQFNIVFFTHETATACSKKAGIVGCYSPSTGRVELTNLAPDPDRAERIGDVVVHELFHAVQAVEIPNINDLWISEGTADAMAFWALEPGNASALLGRRVGTTWRNWRFPLRDQTDVARPYRTFEFFVLAGNGDMRYLRELFTSLAKQTTGNSYDQMDAALEEALGEPLPTILINDVFLNRGASTGYPHCEQEFVDAGGTLLLNGDLAPMSSQCFEVSGLNSDSECFEVTLLTAAINLNQVLILNGQDSFNGEPLFVRGNFADIQVGDWDQDRADTVKEDFQLRVEAAACPTELLNCQNKRISCVAEDPAIPREHSCSLETQAPDGACWAVVATCSPSTGCLRAGGDPFDFGICTATRSIMTDPNSVGIITDTGLPATQDCGTTNLCRMIVLCAK